MELTREGEGTQTSTAAAVPSLALLGWLPLLLLPVLAIVFLQDGPAWVFMWALSFAIFLGLKWQTWWAVRTYIPHGIGRSLAYLFAWPGMDAETFLDSRRAASTPRLREWLWAFLQTFCGVVLLWIVARMVSPRYELARGWIGLLGLALLLHFGTFHLLALFWRALGVSAEPIMAKPIRSNTLSEFWGKRWNLGFRQLAHDLIFKPAHRRIGVTAAGLLVFLASGLIHDLVISLPARGGYGLPTTYFVLQGLGVSLEHSGLGRKLRLQNGVAARSFMLVMTAAPAFWLFHPPFVVRVIVPFMHAIHAL